MLSNRFWNQVTKVERPWLDCWLWTGALNQNGYGRMAFGSADKGTRVRMAAHRLSYEMYVGPIPAGFQLDHLCRNRACVNPRHLELVTGKENTLRGVSPAATNARKTHCIHGHEFTPENTLLDRNGWRACRTCRQRIQKVYRDGARTARSVTSDAGPVAAQGTALRSLSPVATARADRGT